MTNVLYLDHAPIVGGAEVVLLNLISALDRQEWVPIVATSNDSPFLPALARARIETVTMPFGRLNRAGVAMPAHLASAVQMVAQLVRKRHIDLLHTNTVRAHIIGSIAALWTRTPLIWTLHDNTFPHALVRLLAPIPRQVITVSKWLCSLYGPLGLAHKTTVVYNGLPLTTSNGTGLCEELGIPCDASRVVNIGRLVAGKAPHLFVQAAQIVSRTIPEAYFILVGGPDRVEPGQRPPDYASVLEQAMGDHGLGKRLILTGYRPDVERFYAAADLLVYCSILPEGLPTVLLEAMRYAQPVVATRIGGAAELVLDGQTGRLVQPGNVQELATAIIELLENKSDARVMGRAGRSRFEAYFDLQAQVTGTIQVYRRTLAISEPEHDDYS